MQEENRNENNEEKIPNKKHRFRHNKNKKEEKSIEMVGEPNTVQEFGATESADKVEIVDELPEDGADEITVGGMEGIKISNEAIATYAGIAISEVPGVYGMDGTFVEALRGRKNVTKGIKVDADEKTAKIDVNIIVEYGARIPEVAFEIQTRVKKSVEAMTGLKVLEVNVHVNGVQKH